MLVRLEASLSAELSRFISLGTYRVVDELVYQWSSHQPDCVHPRKPYPVGHMFYELAVWVECPEHDKPLPYLIPSTSHSSSKATTVTSLDPQHMPRCL